MIVAFHIASTVLPFTSRIDYILDFLNQHPFCPKDIQLQRESGSLPGENLCIQYGPRDAGPSTGYHIPTQQLIFSKTTPHCQRWYANAYRYDSFSIYSVEEGETPSQAFVVDQTFGFDLIETLFFHLSRFEEYHCSPTDWDEWEMMRSNLQFLPRHRLHHQPVVDRLVYCFFDALGLKPLRPLTTFGMSHDIDVFRKYTSWYRFGRTTARMLRDGHRIGKLLQSWNTFRGVRTGRRKDPYDTFDWLLQGKKFTQKHIYFLSGGITRYDRFYQIAESYVPATIRLAEERGYTIGLHPSYLAHQDCQLIEEEKNRLEKIVGHQIIDSRQHFLHFYHQQTLSLLEQFNIQRDATLGYQDLIGFRCGTGFPYRLYHLAEERISSVTEIPMVVMDTALLMRLKDHVEAFLEQLILFLQKNEELTHITFNFHNSTFDPLRLNSQLLKEAYLALPA